MQSNAIVAQKSQIDELTKEREELRAEIRFLMSGKKREKFIGADPLLIEFEDDKELQAALEAARLVPDVWKTYHPEGYEPIALRSVKRRHRPRWSKRPSVASGASFGNQCRGNPGYRRTRPRQPKNHSILPVRLHDMNKSFSSQTWTGWTWTGCSGDRWFSNPRREMMGGTVVLPLDLGAGTFGECHECRFEIDLFFGESLDCDTAANKQCRQR